MAHASIKKANLIIFAFHMFEEFFSTIYIHQNSKIHSE